MSKKFIRTSLDSEDIKRAIKELEDYKKSFQEKVNVFRERIAEEIADIASLNFSRAMVNDVIKGDVPRKAQVEVTFSHENTISVVIAEGEDAIWCEFGAGVYHNGSAGSSPHPKGGELGFTIGSYGKGYGNRQVWGYYTDPDSKTGLVLTRGTPATMPMYNAAQEVLRKAIDIAREVFK